ncbi:hypothetical protein Cus16_2153 [Curtobacterium sp. ER1/6]|nr:hypothetical protein Cus16_2153 [Curtobacterium sp. ER1/6]
MLSQAQTRVDPPLTTGVIFGVLHDAADCRAGATALAVPSPPTSWDRQPTGHRRHPAD